MPAKMFGVETKDDFYAKYIAQGCWTRCLQCQRSAGIGFTSSSDNIKFHFVGKDDVVEATAENLSCDMLDVENVDPSSHKNISQHKCGRMTKDIKKISFATAASSKASHLVCTRSTRARSVNLL